MRIIDADALIDNMVDYVVDGYAESPIDFESYTKMVQTAPTIEAVSVVHGEWIISYMGGRKQTECSACGKSFTTYDVYGWNYCPWCGAKMKGADDE